MGKHDLRRFMLGAFLAIASLTAPAFEIYQLPMFATGAATPNVMLLVDNSGSMDNMVWADAFSPATSYQDWSSEWSPSDGNVHLSDLSQTGCSGGRYRGVRGGTTKCLKLPSPMGTSTRYDGNYLNFLFATYADNADLTTGTIPTETRMQVARAVATDMVNTITGVRFGLSTFYGPSSQNYGYGATILEPCEDASSSGHASDLVSGIAGLTSDNNTPLSEALYEVTRYFRGMSSYYHGSTSYTSPLQYRCQRNFTIVITDGFPTYDTQIPTNDPADTADTTRALPDWDGVHPATTFSQKPLFPQYSDGFQPESGRSQADEAWSLYLDDIAKFAYDIDFITSGNDLDGKPWGSLTDPAPTGGQPDFRQQRMETYTVGFATANQMLEDAAEYGHGQYYTAKNAVDLKDALEQVLTDIQNKATAAASVSLNSTRLDANTLLYQASFDSAKWSGDLKAFPVDQATGAVQASVWSAKDHVPVPASRTVITQNSSSRAGIAATWANLTTGQQTALKLITEPTSCSTCSCIGNGNSAKNCRANCSKCTPSITGRGDEVLAYLLGDRSGEAQNNGDFRDRDTVLGDIVNSDPLFVGNPNYGYHTLSGSEGTGYTAFRATTAYLNRPPMVYVGANDGLLHAIDAREAVASGGGTEKFAYMPLTVFPNLKKLTSVSYTHQFYVNGSPQAGDAYIASAWKTVLVGTLGAGGRGVFALDITDPTTFGPSKVMWEKAVTGDANIAITDDADLGFTYGQASIGRMANGKWAAIVGNGLNSANRRAVLFIYDLQDGSLIKKIDTGIGSTTLDNGLSTPVIVDTNNDKIVEYIYAGDMQGNLWKFNVSDPSATNWDVAYTSGGVKTPLYKATAPDGTAQPITAKPQVTRRPDGDLQVLFGTGKYFEGQDRSVPTSPTPQTQTFYGIRDPNAAITNGRTNLAQQSVISMTTLSGFTVRTTTAQQPTSTTQNGWYMDLPTAGERQVSRAVLRTGRIIFTTVIPNSDSCSAGGTSWLMEVDALTGSRLAQSPFDLDNDGAFNETVTITVIINGQPQNIQVPVSGVQSQVGVMGTAGVAQEGNREFKYISGSSGGIQVTLEPGDLGAGRQSWQQLQ